MRFCAGKAGKIYVLPLAKKGLFWYNYGLMAEENTKQSTTTQSPVKSTGDDRDKRISADAARADAQAAGMRLPDGETKPKKKRRRRHRGKRRHANNDQVTGNANNADGVSQASQVQTQQHSSAVKSDDQVQKQHETEPVKPQTTAKSGVKSGPVQNLPARTNARYSEEMAKKAAQMPVKVQAVSSLDVSPTPAATDKKQTPGKNEKNKTVPRDQDEKAKLQAKSAPKGENKKSDKATLASDNQATDVLASEKSDKNKNQLPPLMVNGKPYKSGEKVEAPRRGLKAAFVGKVKESQPKSEAATPNLDQILEQTEPQVSESAQTEKILEAQKTETNAGPELEDLGEQRFTPHLSTTDLKAATPTFSLQDIQRTRRRRKLVIIGVSLVILVALYVMWSGFHLAQHSTDESMPPSPVAEETSESIDNKAKKATLAGTVDTSRISFPSPILDRIAIYVSAGETAGMRDTGIRLLPDETEWQFAHASDGQEYRVQAVLVDSGREITYSEVVTVTAPANGIRLVFPSNPELTTSMLNAKHAGTPVRVELEESPSISGTVQVRGSIPAGSQVVVWLGENNSGGEMHQDAYTFNVLGGEVAYTISNLQTDKEYVLDAVLKGSDGQILSLASQTVIARPPATDANFDIEVR